MNARSLKIESDGDPWKGLIKPKIRLKGHWLERAGFQPGRRVRIEFLAPGRLEMRLEIPPADGEPSFPF